LDVGRSPSLFNGRLGNLIAVIGIVGPVVLYVWYIHQYGVNAIWFDQWDSIALITHSHYLGWSYAGHLSLGQLWSQYVENRMLFFNLLVLLVSSVTHFNVVTELYLGGIFLAAAVILIILAHRRARPSTPWLFYCPVAMMMLSLVFAGATLYGFQMSWFMILLAMAVTLFLLDRRDLGRIALLGAVVAAIVGSFSSLQGLLIWPSGLAVLAYRRQRRSIITGWIGAAIITTAVYFYHLDLSGTGA
jgi:hypothetical protein